MQINISELKSAPQFPAIRKLAILNLVFWIAAVALFISVFAMKSERTEKINEADAVLKGAMRVKSYPTRDSAVKSEPLAIVSGILNKYGLEDRVQQLSASGGNLSLQVNRLYPDELESLVNGIKENDLLVNTAEIKVMTSRTDGKLLNFALTLEGIKE